MKFDILRTRRGKLSDRINKELSKSEPSLEELLVIFNEYEKNNLDTIEKLKKEKLYETKRISGALKQTINAHSVITKELIGSATKRIYGALLVEKSKKQIIKEKVFNKISSIYHTFYFIFIFMIKGLNMKTIKNKISITISDENNSKLINKSINKSKLIDKLLTEYFKIKENELYK